MKKIIYIIVSIILLVLIIVHNIYQKKKYKEVYKDTLYQKTNKLKKIIYILSVIVFIVFLLINIKPLISSKNIIETLTYITNALSIAILVSPLTISNLYIHSFKEEEKKSHIKTIITNKIEKKLLKKLKKADINIILLSKDENKCGINIINEKEFKKNYISKNIQINTDNINFLDKLINKESIVKETENLENLYNEISNARGVHDNYIRNLKYIIRTYLSIILSITFFLIMGFPLIYNILLVLTLKVLTILTSNYIYKYLPFDKDIMERKVKDKKILLGKQEILFTIIESFCVSFAISIPYMFTLSQGGSQELANTLYFIVFTYTELFYIYSNLSDSFILINIVKSIKNIRLIIFTIISILIIIFFNYIDIFNTRNIYLQNNLSCILFSMIPIIFNEFTKLSRYMSMKGRKKHELKNHKKQRRS